MQHLNVITLPPEIARGIKVLGCSANEDHQVDAEKGIRDKENEYEKIIYNNNNIYVYNIYCKQQVLPINSKFLFHIWRNMSICNDFVFDKSTADLYTAMQQAFFERLGAYNPFILFQLFVDDEFINCLVDCIMKYAGINCNDPTFCTDYEEISPFIADLSLFGYSSEPSIRSYWSDYATLGVQCVKEKMIHERFKWIKKYFHVCDNPQLDAQDKFSKVTPLYDMMNSRFMQFGIFYF